MRDEKGLVTVFRSAEPDADAEAGEVREILAEAGLNAVLCGEDSPGVAAGSWEVRVPEAEAGRAEEILAEAEVPDEPGDDSEALDLQTVFSAEGTTAEMEALGVRSVLEANGIQGVLVGASALPNLSFEVRVAREDYDAAVAAMREAQAAGPQAAEEAERSGESGPSEA